MHGNSIRVMKSLIGQEFSTNTSGKCFVIGYKNNRNVVVAFYNPIYFTTCELGDLRKGKVKNPLFPSIYGKGCVGVGKYSPEDKRLFTLWKSMMRRAYCEDFKLKNLTYKDVSVCKEWLDFQVFAEWCVSQKGFESKDENNKPFQLDKDGMVIGNKIYSPTTCCFLPQKVNKLLMRPNKKVGKYLTGVDYSSKSDMYLSRFNYLGRKKSLGNFSTEKEAHEAHREAKVNYLKELLNYYKADLDEDVYKILLNTPLSFWD